MLAVARRRQEQGRRAAALSYWAYKEPASPHVCDLGDDLLGVRIWREGPA
ncbi:MAG: hypothetical protein WKF73_07020 [Nocardioidaceae bacterium]